MKKVYIDFEFNRVSHPTVNLVCACTLDGQTGERKKWWLHGENKRKLAAYLIKYNMVIGYSCVAEARSYLALTLNPLDYEWKDLFLEYRLISNHNDRINWGKQLVDGRVKFTVKPKPKWERTEQDEGGFKPSHSLSEATYKMTGAIRDTAHKTKMRDLIISDPKSFSPEDRDAIMDYCMEDVIHLPKLEEKIREEFKTLNGSLQGYEEEAKTRGRYSAHTALMESHGYPFSEEKTRNFSGQIGPIIYALQDEINTLFPDVKPFKWNKKERRFSWNKKATQAWVEANHDVRRWKKTDKKAISLSLKAFEQFYDFKHDYPTDNFGAQMVRFLKLQQSLYGFARSGGNRRNFWDSVGPDERVRPYMNIYGAQSSRSQPAATGFMFLKPAWMRALVEPKPGKFMCGIDYGQQEFFVAGLLSGDENMVKAYLSGDPYFYTAQLAGAIPWGAKKENHKAVRDLFKATTLAMLFMMTKYGLATKLTNDTGRTWTEDEAQEQIDLFEDAYSIFIDYRKEVASLYEAGEPLKLPCGWRCWLDNDNLRSVCNVPIQGFGASVMRKAVDLAVTKGVRVLFTLHDAIYMEGDVGNERDILILKDAMRDAFIHYFQGDARGTAEHIKLDPFAWSPEYKPDSEITIGGWPVPLNNLYLDERSIRDYSKFSRYFEKPEADFL